VNNIQRQGQQVTLRKVYGLFGKAFIKACKMETAVNSFKKTGIYPFDASVFTASDFVNLRDTEVINNLSLDSSNSTDSSKVAECHQVIKEIINLNPSINTSALSTTIQSNLIFNQPAVSVENCDSNSEPMIAIPCSYIVKAAPLINLLSSSLSSLSIPTRPQSLQRTCDFTAASTVLTVLRLQFLSILTFKYTIYCDYNLQL